MLSRITPPFVRVFSRWMPDPYIFAVLLTLLVMVSALIFTPTEPIEMVGAWGNSFWNLLTFTCQMVMVLVTGHALAHTKFVHDLIVRGAKKVNSAFQAYVVVGFIACAAAWFNWSLGLIAGALIAREVAVVCRSKNINVHYPLLIAAAYTAFAVWHQGLSSSIGLTIATEGHFLESTIGVISLKETLFAPWNLKIVFFVIVTLPFVMASLRPKPHLTVPISEHVGIDEGLEGLDVMDAIDHSEKPKKSPAERMEDSKLLNILVGLAGLTYLFYYFLVLDKSLNLNMVNFIFLILGILLSNSPIHYVNLISNACKCAGPILFQFPFYAGIMGVMSYSGLSTMLTEWFVGLSTAESLPFYSFLSAGLLNIFVPSGGGQWAVQGPIMMDAAIELGANIPKVAMAVAMGDQWTNMIQPFWALPALAIAGLHVRDIMGYCVFALIWCGIIFGCGLLLT